MGTFRKKIGLSNSQGGDELEAETLVDTGAVHSMFPAALLHQLQVEPVSQRELTFANGDTATLDVGVATISIDGEKLPCLVIFGPEENQYLLGATTLEIFDLIVDPSRRELVRRQYIARSL